MADIGLKETNQTISIYNNGSFWEYDVKYDIHTKLVYLANNRDLMPYMKDATTQYIWNTEKNAIK